MPRTLPVGGGGGSLGPIFADQAGAACTGLVAGLPFSGLHRTRLFCNYAEDEEPGVICAVGSADRGGASVCLPRVAEIGGNVRWYGRERRSRGFSFAALVCRRARNRRRVGDPDRPLYAPGGIRALRRNGGGLLSKPRPAGNVAHSEWRGTGGAVLLHLSVPVGCGSRAYQRGLADSAREEDRSLGEAGLGMSARPKGPGRQECLPYGLRSETHVMAAPMQTMMAAETNGR